MFYFIVSRTNILLHNRVVCLGCYLISFENWVKFSVPSTTKGKEWGKVLLQVPFKRVFIVATSCLLNVLLKVKWSHILISSMNSINRTNGKLLSWHFEQRHLRVGECYHWKWKKNSMSWLSKEEQLPNFVKAAYFVPCLKPTSFDLYFT